MNPRGLLPPPAPSGVGAPSRGAAGGLSLGPLEIAGAMKGPAGKVPPNLGHAEDPSISCETCVHFEGAGGCSRYQYPVTPEQTCDSWESAEQGEPDPAEPMPMGGDMLPPMPGMEG